MRFGGQQWLGNPLNEFHVLIEMLDDHRATVDPVSAIDAGDSGGCGSYAAERTFSGDRNASIKLTCFALAMPRCRSLTWP